MLSTRLSWWDLYLLAEGRSAALLDTTTPWIIGLYGAVREEAG